MVVVVVVVLVVRLVGVVVVGRAPFSNSAPLRGAWCWEEGGGGGTTYPPSAGPTHPSPLKRVGQIFFWAFGQSKISFVPLAQIGAKKDSYDRFWAAFHGTTIPRQPG